MSRMSDEVGEVSSLYLRYGPTIALDSITINIPAHQLVGFIGPDGVGKSSLLGTIAGARQIESGTVRVLGENMADARRRAAICSRIAYMPQGLGRNLYPNLTVRENMEYFSKLFGQNKLERTRRIQTLLQGIGLAPFADRPSGKLSGGMRQKLGLCCSLIHDPDLLILDEPTTGVDPLSRRQFWQLIAQMRASRRGVGRRKIAEIVQAAFADRDHFGPLQKMAQLAAQRRIEASRVMRVNARGAGKNAGMRRRQRRRLKGACQVGAGDHLAPYPGLERACHHRVTIRCKAVMGEIRPNINQ